jgi:hypothetical protein
MNNNKKAASSTLSPCSSSNTMSPISSPHNEFINILIDNPATSLTSLDKQLTKFNQDQKREEDRTQSFLAKVNARITNNMINNSSNNNNSKNGSNTFNFESNVTNTTKKMPPNNKLIADNLFTNTINNQASNRTSKRFSYYFFFVFVYILAKIYLKYFFVFYFFYNECFLY